MRFALLLAVTACTPCELESVVDDPTAAPGEVRHAFALDRDADVTPASSGVACLTCDSVFQLDGQLAEQRRMSVSLAGSGTTAVYDDTTYVFDRDYGREPDIDDHTSRPPHFQLFALSASGDERWRVDLGDGEEWMGTTMPGIVAGPTGVFAFGEKVAALFDAETGVRQWSTPLRFGSTIAPDPGGGLFVASGGFAFGPATVEATITHFDSNGVASWSKRWTTTGTEPNRPTTVGAEAMAGGPGGGIVMIGSFSGGAVDFGDRVIGDASTPNFVISLDANGATQWVVPFAHIPNLQRLALATAVDTVVIAGQYSGDGAALGLPPSSSMDSFVARISPGGEFAARHLGGDGFQTIYGLAAADDGSAIVTVFNGPDGGSAILRVGSRAFDNGSSARLYLLQLLP